MTTEETSLSAPEAEADAASEAGKPSAREQSRQLLGRLVETYPKAFFPLSARQVHPLKLGIHKDLQPVIKDWGYEPLALKLALAAYIRQLRYQISITKEAQRVDLTGAPAGEISDEHRQKAQEQVETIRATRKARQPAGAGKPARPAAAAAGSDAPADAEAPATAATAATAAEPTARPPRRGPRPDGERRPARKPAEGEASATATAPAREPRRERRPRPDGEAPRRRADRGDRKEPRREREPVRASAAPEQPVESAFASLLREALAKQDAPEKP